MVHKASLGRNCKVISCLWPVRLGYVLTLLRNIGDVFIYSPFLHVARTVTDDLGVQEFPFPSDTQIKQVAVISVLFIREAVSEQTSKLSSV